MAGVAAAALGGSALLAGVFGDGEAPVPGSPCPGSVGERDTDALLRCLRPSLALLETPLATGSGVLVEGRYLVTNAHVVEPFDSTTVIFRMASVTYRSQRQAAGNVESPCAAESRLGGRT